jgi:bifunctional DNA-binding transcriptional regulator/antitoxin component of YhaV-PrlF toxin-antitoxin module
VTRSGGSPVNEAGAKKELGSQTNARAKLRSKAQLTLPDPIKQALHVSEGDEIEFAVHEDGVITVRGYVSVPSDQAWRFKSGEQAAGW